MPLGACRLNRRILVLVAGLWASLAFISCGSSKPKNPPSGLKERVLASQGVSSTFTFGSLVILNGSNDTIPRVSPIAAGNTPGLMALSPTRNIAAAFDPGTNTVFAVDTNREATIGNVRLPGPTTSMVLPSASPIGYAAVPTATITGFSFLGAVDVMNFLGGGLTTTIAVNNAQTVIADSTGSQLLVFSNDSDSVTVLSPGVAVPPVDTSCYSATSPNPGVCNIIPGFDRPVYGIVSGGTALILNCGAECGGVQASVQTLDLSTFALGTPIPVDAATWALLNGSTLYVAGTSKTNNACTGQTTAATTCGRLDVVDLNSGTVTATAVITDGYHNRMDMTVNGQIFIGSHNCTNIGNASNPSGGEVRGCLSIFKTADNSVLIPPDNGDVNGLQGFNTRNIEYVAEGGMLRVYDTTKDILLINNFLPQGTINIVGYVGDVKAIDFF
jgi:hypothetical protein